MSGFADYEPFSYEDTYNVRVTSANTTVQLARMPWADPINRVGVLKKVCITNLDGTGAVVHMWDQDQSSTTPSTAGSAGTALVVLGVGASGASGTAGTTAVYGEKDLPQRRFFGGISVQCSKINVDIAATISFV